MIKNLLIVLIVIIPSLNIAQKLSGYQWHNRLLVISNPLNNLEKETEQLELLGSLDQDFKERKILVLKLTNHNYTVLNSNVTTNTSDPIGIEGLTLSEKEFSILLIGLDGGIKLRQNQSIKRDELFAIIDGMPIRQSELRQKN
ncbi:DUF4174 domain-containing protein [Winogradskyella aurantiaca]|uniref:DUF4174 domain-containing protein n=1 Tax=Winogradskyella aurantiaca TaxID=2219558 RepID=UPI000E1C49A5|nr:DUF4174 domain-containing protein [Winogradskyella aurantiaca]